ncbi:Gfo/Idh/MocA family protein [Oceanobacillus sp. CFH 90083]|uniref:Gfo/Idh/MocA family protein n=1 Tax=Oceanobacillus sp. CFH 90083 TaxID=2592336 RepID=UPI00128DAD86|nr:Gfo/Idh/MocA family oxidoreductase [Oceanobacillus sp. CFH 90083]
MTLKIGIIGCGGIAFSKHMPSLSRFSDLVELKAFCDLDGQKAEHAKEKFGNSEALVYNDYIQLLKNQEIDVVHVLTPNASHAEITIKALEAGKHVMCEKPMAINSEEAKKMVEAAERTGKKLTIGYQNRFREDAQILYQACKEGKLGEIYYSKAHAVRRRAVPTWGVFTNKEAQGGGALIDIGTHALDLALWMMNNYRPKLVVGTASQKLKDKTEGNLFGDWDPTTFDVEDFATAFIKMENGATISLEASWALNIEKGREAEVTLCGTEAGGELKRREDEKERYVSFYSSEYGKLTDTHTAAGSSIAYFGGENLNEGEQEAKMWIEAILEDKSPLVQPKEALVVTQILEAIYQSALTGKAVEFD